MQHGLRHSRRPEREPRGPDDAPLVADVLVTESAIIAHPPVVHSRVEAGLESIHVVLVMVHIDRTTRAASRTDRRSRFQEPHPLLEQKVLVQCLVVLLEPADVVDVRLTFVIDAHRLHILLEFVQLLFYFGEVRPIPIKPPNAPDIIVALSR